ncbi:MAG: NAD(P)-dependent dehydrogenase (short-subunit alcohol dehydrogenase family) [Candidatus Azotimanducaceae bacterium]|jgi:NAD(P)-dependent dehydrogenase (short-subunit alcohol dehydrogenase family)
MTKPLAIISGGAKGVGLAFTQRLIAEGYAALSFDTAPHSFEHADLVTVNADSSQRADVDQIVKMAAEIGGLQMVVNNARIWQPTPLNSSWQQLLDDWELIMDTNVRGALMLSRATVPLLKESGGHIINISSTDVLPPKQTPTNPPDSDLYNASMWALNGFTDAWSKRLAKYDICVNSICLGKLSEEFLPMADVAQLLIDVISSGRTGENFGAWPGEPVTIGDQPPLHKRITG